MLTEIYGWFTEDFDTADLKDGNARVAERLAACVLISCQALLDGCFA